MTRKIMKWFQGILNSWKLKPLFMTPVCLRKRVVFHTSATGYAELKLSRSRQLLRTAWETSFLPAFYWFQNVYNSFLHK